MLRMTLKFAAVWFVCLSSLLAYSAVKTAVLIASGEVSVNGASIRRSTTVFEGDRLTTGANAGVMLHLRGATVQLSESSDARFEGEKLSLVSGAALIHGSESVIAGPFLIVAMNDANFRIERSGTITKLAILKGRLKVTRGKSSMVLDGAGERQFSDEDTITNVGRRPVVRQAAVGAAGGASGAAVTGWMKQGNNAASVSRKSPSQP
jgi:hypothetical protein